MPPRATMWPLLRMPTWWQNRSARSMTWVEKKTVVPRWATMSRRMFLMARVEMGSNMVARGGIPELRQRAGLSEAAPLEDVFLHAVQAPHQLHVLRRREPLV